MIMRGWEIIQIGSTHMAKEFVRGKDGMGENVDKYTGNEISGPIENIRETLLVDMKLECCTIKPQREGSVEIWW